MKKHTVDCTTQYATLASTEDSTCYGNVTRYVYKCHYTRHAPLHSPRALVCTLRHINVKLERKLKRFLLLVLPTAIPRVAFIIYYTGIDETLPTHGTLFVVHVQYLFVVVNVPHKIKPR